MHCKGTLHQRGRLLRLRALPNAADGRFSPPAQNQTLLVASGDPAGHFEEVWEVWELSQEVGLAAPRTGPALFHIDVVRAGLSPAASSASGATGQARAGDRGPLPTHHCPRDICSP